MSKESLLECESIVKSFGDNHVLKGIDLCLHSGEVISIIGGNGAGKSTLMKIIMGIYRADRGKLVLSGKELKNINPSIALSNGVYLVPQEPMLFSNMTVQENILLGLKGKKTENKKKLDSLIEELGWKIDVYRQAMTLSIAEQQLVEILKGIIRESKILILDEPTSSLTFNEIKSLFSVIEDLKSKGVGIIYITHRLNEVFEISTHVVIMRDGKITLKGKVSEFNNELLIKALLPEESKLDVERKLTEEVVEKKGDGHSVLKIENLSGNGFSNVSFDVYSGEILGLAGVVGAGRTELAETIFGRDKVHSGKVSLEGTDITSLPTRKVIESGLNYVPEDRFKNGIFKISDIGMNISSASLRSMGKFFINKNYEGELYLEYKDSFKIKSSSINEEIANLSGGNQQKVVIAKALASIPKILILDEPTRGIDAGAREDVYKIIYKLKSEGVAILLISSDMEEIVQLADRALTMYRGKINAQYVKKEINPENLMSSSFGVTKEVVS
ncbi:ATP-binding cassette domain-containing protein [Paenibacillus albiflavus]|uniref:Autoinducer 2 import ATP-binding protein LsrA n=1 Tax=Paenibacillus albiflavus TaxID=2545760 RepID=A0A4R4E1U8_9BACL|nr:ATP-binding cassette domain-containing protein [Paenibacillus albiflavus]TCZ69938.1 ATP-binding cassette domain-containing protein [Paenibacillus albiflavus]